MRGSDVDVDRLDLERLGALLSDIEEAVDLLWGEANGGKVGQWVWRMFAVRQCARVCVVRVEAMLGRETMNGKGRARPHGIQTHD